MAWAVYCRYSCDGLLLGYGGGVAGNDGMCMERPCLPVWLRVSTLTKQEILEKKDRSLLGSYFFFYLNV
mgnify:CR=1 FL=1